MAGRETLVLNHENSLRVVHIKTHQIHHNVALIFRLQNKAVISKHLSGTIERQWGTHGLRLRLPRRRGEVRRLSENKETALLGRSKVARPRSSPWENHYQLTIKLDTNWTLRKSISLQNYECISLWSCRQSVYEVERRAILMTFSNGLNRQHHACTQSDVTVLTLMSKASADAPLAAIHCHCYPWVSFGYSLCRIFGNIHDSSTISLNVN